MTRAARTGRRLPRRKLLAAAIIVMLALMTGGSFLHRNSVRPGGDEPRSGVPGEQAGPVGGPAERALWEAARRADSEDLLVQYVTSYPQGEFIALAEAKLRAISLRVPEPSAEAEPPGDHPDGGRPGGVREAAAEPPPPPPPPPLPSPVVRPVPTSPAEEAETVTVSRYPTLDAPADAVVGEVIEVMVALTEEQFTPDVTIRPSGDTDISDGGEINLRGLPARPDGWLLDVELAASGFELEGEGSMLREMKLEPYGDSEYLYFRLRARSISGETRRAIIQARFFLEGRYLGSVSRPVLVRRTQQAPAPAMPGVTMAADTVPAVVVPVASVLSLGDTQEVADLTVMIDYEDPAKLGKAVMSFHSPHFRPVRTQVETNPDLQRWLDGYTSRMAALTDARGASPMPSTSAATARAVAEVTLAGLGRELYQYYVPEQFKQVFWRLKDQGKLRSIQITSNNTALPWELVRPVRPDGTGDDEFLGVGYRLARWALLDSIGQDDAPRDRLAFGGVAAIAPPYPGGAHLPYQEMEVQAMSRLTGFQRLSGDFASIRTLLSGAPQSFVHFSGHGQVSEQVAATPVFAIMLTDTLLEPATWQAMLAPPFMGQGTFYFFNACDIGQSGTYAGFLQGWGPTLLQSGASGFIGGMWPLPDRSAADFSAQFYARLADRLDSGPVHLADVLRETRARFYETGDPTYLAYAYYGNVNLQVTPP